MPCPFPEDLRNLGIKPWSLTYPALTGSLPLALHGKPTKQAEHQRIDAFDCGAEEDLRVPWTARRSNQSILKEVSPECSLEGLTEAEAPILRPPDAKRRLIRKDPDSGKD